MAEFEMRQITERLSAIENLLSGTSPAVASAPAAKPTRDRHLDDDVKRIEDACGRLEGATARIEERLEVLAQMMNMLVPAPAPAPEPKDSQDSPERTETAPKAVEAPLTPPTSPSEDNQAS